MPKNRKGYYRVDRWLERTYSAFEAPVTNRAPRSQSLARFYIHFLIALGHLISKTYRGNGFPSLLLRTLSSSPLCTQHFVLIAWTYSIVSASTTNQWNIAVQGETHLKRGWGIHNLWNSLMPLIPEGKNICLLKTGEIIYNPFIKQKTETLLWFFSVFDTTKFNIRLIHLPGIVHALLYIYFLKQLSWKYRHKNGTGMKLALIIIKDREIK